MADVDLRITLDRDPAIFRGGEVVEGTLELESKKDCECRALTISASWKAASKYEADEGHVAETQLFAGHLKSGQRASYRFSVQLPDTLWTYTGATFNVIWSVHAKADLAGLADAHAYVPMNVSPKAGLTAEALAPGLGAIVPVDQGGPAIPLVADRSILADRMGAKVQTGCLIGTGIFTLLFAIPFIVALTVMISTLGSVILGQVGPLAIVPMILFAVVGVVLPVGSGLVMIYAGSRPLLARRFVGPVTVSIDPLLSGPGTPLRCTVSFQPGRALELQRVVIKLRARETVWRHAKNGRRAQFRQVRLEEHDIEGGRIVRAGELVELNGTINVPTDAVYSLGAPFHQLEWHIIVQIAIRGWLDYSSEHLVTVAPVSSAPDVF